MTHERVSSVIQSEDIAAVYALDLAPRQIPPTRVLGLVPDRVYREYRIYRSRIALQPAKPPSPQLDLLMECVACL